MVPQLVLIALALWGWLLPMHVTVHSSLEVPAYDNIQATTAFIDGGMEGGLFDPEQQSSDCIIYVVPRFFDRLSLVEQQAVITHEVGHCLGLHHITAAGIMYPYTSGQTTTLTDADWIEFYRVHPLPVRGRAVIAHE